MKKVRVWFGSSVCYGTTTKTTTTVIADAAAIDQRTFTAESMRKDGWTNVRKIGWTDRWTDRQTRQTNRQDRPTDGYP